MLVVEDEASRGKGIEFLNYGLMIGVLEILSKTIRRPEADEEPVGIASGSPAEVLPDGEIYHARNLAL